MPTLPSFVPAGLTDQKNKLADHVSVLTSIRAYAIGVEQTNLQTIINPVPDWFTTLNTNIGIAKKHVEVWTTTLEPAIVSTVPQAAITFGNKFKVGSASILNILSSSNYNPSADQIKNIGAALTWMVKGIDDQSSNITTLKGQFTTFQTNAATDLTALTTGNSSIQKALDIDNQKITELTADIAIQNANIAADNAAITAAGIAGGVGLFVGVAMVGFGAAATGPAAPVVMAIGAFIMVGSIVEMATVMAIYGKKLAEAQNKLSQDTSDLKNEQQQVASLTLMNNSVGSLVDKNKNMAQSLSDIANWWAIIETDIKAVATDFVAVSADMKSSDWFAMSLDLQQAQEDWAVFVKFATGLQETVTTIQNKVVIVNSDTAPTVTTRKLVAA